MGVSALTQADVRSRLRYEPETGALIRTVPTRHSQIGTRIGVPCKKGHRNGWFLGANRQTAHLVWLYHYGEWPSGFLRHRNGDDSDDRIENLEVIKKSFRIAYQHDPCERDQRGSLAWGVSGIYAIRCIHNGRRYIGSACDLHKRWRLHYTHLQSSRHHSRHLQRAWAKYGEDGFVFVVLEECPREKLIEREQHHIDSLRPEFNSRPKAGSQLGYKHSQESRARMSASRPKDFSPMKGRTHTPGARAKISASKKGKRLGPYSASRIEATARAMRESKGAATDEQVRETRRLKSLGMKHADVSEIVGISYSAVADIARGRTFSWVT